MWLAGYLSATNWTLSIAKWSVSVFRQCMWRRATARFIFSEQCLFVGRHSSLAGSGEGVYCFPLGEWKSAAIPYMTTWYHCFFLKNLQHLTFSQNKNRGSQDSKCDQKKVIVTTKFMVIYNIWWANVHAVQDYSDPNSGNGLFWDCVTHAVSKQGRVWNDFFGARRRQSAPVEGAWEAFGDGA